MGKTMVKIEATEYNCMRVKATTEVLESILDTMTEEGSLIALNSFVGAVNGDMVSLHITKSIMEGRDSIGTGALIPLTQVAFVENDYTELVIDMMFVDDIDAAAFDATFKKYLEYTDKQLKEEEAEETSPEPEFEEKQSSDDIINKITAQFEDENYKNIVARINGLVEIINQLKTNNKQ